MNFNFRAWDKTTNQMRECYGFNVLENIAFVCSAANDELKGRIKTCHAIERQLEDVDIMESTGLYDVNNKEIYEWDIVEYKIGFFSEPQKFMVYRGYDGEYRLDSPTSGCPLWTIGLNVKVIGNIFENPDLMDKDYVDKRVRDLERWSESK